MDRTSLILAALAPARGARFTPVQVQKLFFLLDRNIAKATNGPHFNFEPYDYGPFDKDVYSALDSMKASGYVDTVKPPGRSWSIYSLTPAGQAAGDAV